MTFGGAFGSVDASFAKNDKTDTADVDTSEMVTQTIGESMNPGETYAERLTQN